LPKSQDRARERRRHEKRQQRLAQREAQFVRDKQAVLAVIGVVVVVFGFIWLANVLSSRSDATPDPASTAQPQSDPSAGPQRTAGAAAPTPTVTPSVLAGCTPPPANQASPKQMSTQPDVEAARGKTFTATVTTNCGPVTVELDGAKAPATVSSFILLAKQAYWAPSACFRLTGDEQGIWVLQCGDPTGTGSGPGPGYHFGVENAPADGKYPAGTLAMARATDPSSNSDQFFIVYKDTQLPTQGGGYSVFGRVTGGMDIINRVAAAGINPQDQTSPLAPISILAVDVQPKG